MQTSTNSSKRLRYFIEAQHCLEVKSSSAIITYKRCRECVWLHPLNRWRIDEQKPQFSNSSAWHLSALNVINKASSHSQNPGKTKTWLGMGAIPKTSLKKWNRMLNPKTAPFFSWSTVAQCFSPCHPPSKHSDPWCPLAYSVDILPISKSFAQNSTRPVPGSAIVPMIPISTSGVPTRKQRYKLEYFACNNEGRMAIFLLRCTTTSNYTRQHPTIHETHSCTKSSTRSISLTTCISAFHILSRLSTPLTFNWEWHQRTLPVGLHCDQEPNNWNECICHCAHLVLDDASWVRSL